MDIEDLFSTATRILEISNVQSLGLAVLQGSVWFTSLFLTFLSSQFSILGTFLRGSLVCKEKQCGKKLFPPPTPGPRNRTGMGGLLGMRVNLRQLQHSSMPPSVLPTGSCTDPGRDLPSSAPQRLSRDPVSVTPGY